jgi:hypothetical protein
MFVISMPRNFKVGDTVDCRINRKPGRVTWRDVGHLVIEPDDARPIVGVSKEGGFISFACGDAGTTHADYGSEMIPNGGGAIVFEQRSTKLERGKA